MRGRRTPILMAAPTAATILPESPEIAMALRDWFRKRPTPLQAALERALAKFQSTYAQDEPSAEKLVAVGESRPDIDLHADEVASWMLVASAAMNLDAVLNK